MLPWDIVEYVWKGEPKRVKVPYTKCEAEQMTPE